MEAFLVSAGLVAIAEIGDKTMLLAILLAATWRKPIPILAGIFVATLLNHALAAGLGALLGSWLQGPWVKWVLGIAFLGFAAWALIPDKLEEGEGKPDAKAKTPWGVFVATAVAFFLVEMGDKTQVATAALGARFPTEVAFVAMGTTLGMMIANTPAVLLGEAAATKLPLKYIRWAAALGFAATGVWVLLS